MNSSQTDLQISLSSGLDLDKISSHRRTQYESIMDRSYNEINKIEVVRIGTKFNESRLEEHVIRKRSKPRRLSGLQGANITEGNFKQSRPLLPRDDSVFLLKHRTTNSIPMIVPLVQADSRGCQEAAEEGPLSSIQRRRKPRRFSGDAVENETRPVLIRDDSVWLTKKKLAKMESLTLESEEEASTSDISLTLELEEAPVAAEEKKEELKVEKTGSTPARAKSARAPRLTRHHKQQGYVRQNSCGARTA